MVDYVTKGSNFWTEHYSAVQADVPDTEDPGTMLNTNLIELLEETDVLALSGQALSHCVANTVIDIANNFGEENNCVVEWDDFNFKIKEIKLRFDNKNKKGFVFIGMEKL